MTIHEDYAGGQVAMHNTCDASSVAALRPTHLDIMMASRNTET